MFLLFNSLLFLMVATNQLYPYTLLNTALECVSIEDCQRGLNNSWCDSAGVICLHHFCKLIADFPCKKTTQRCLEAEQRCEPITCTMHTECDNGIYCDGAEVCEAGICVTDPTQPNCLYSGGECDEVRQLCKQPKARLAWRTHREERRLLSVSTTDATSLISQLQVDLTALIAVAAFIFVAFLVAIIYLVSRSIRAGYTKKRYA